MKKLLLCILAASMFAACSKNLDHEGPIDASKQKTLMDKAWQLKAYTIDPNIDDPADLPVDGYAPLAACVKDNYYVFSNSTIALHDHYQKCYATTPDVLTYGYALTGNETHIRMWSNLDDPDNSVVLDGKLQFPDVDTFTVEYQVYDSTTQITSDHIKTFAKIIPD